jgi:hypothetical protein
MEETEIYDDPRFKAEDIDGFVIEGPFLVEMKNEGYRALTYNVYALSHPHLIFKCIADLGMLNRAYDPKGYIHYSLHMAVDSIKMKIEQGGK